MAHPSRRCHQAGPVPAWTLERDLDPWGGSSCTGGLRFDFNRSHDTQRSQGCGAELTRSRRLHRQKVNKARAEKRLEETGTSAEPFDDEIQLGELQTPTPNSD